MPNLMEILQKNNVNFRQHGDHHHASHGWISVDCPYCSPNSNRFRLGFEIATGRTNCWVCGSKNKAHALSKVCKIPYQEAIIFCRDSTYHYISEKFERYSGTLKVPIEIEPMLPAHRNYLINRGFQSLEIERLWGVKGIGIAEKLQWRLFIPIHNKFGTWVSWTTRSINEHAKRRYISASSDQEAVPHKSILYGAHLARQTIIIVEGPLDAWAIGPGAVATCGLSFSKAQFNEMSKYQNRVICFDSEKDAQRRARELLERLASFGMTENVILETGSDPASANKKEIQELRKEFLE